MVCSVQPVQDNHNGKRHVRFSCLSFPSVLHMAATQNSPRSSGFSSSQGSPEFGSAQGQALAITMCTPSGALFVVLASKTI